MIIDQLFTRPLFEEAPMASPEQLAYNRLRAQWEGYQKMTSGGGNTVVSRDPVHAAKLATVPTELARMAAALKAKGIDAEAEYDALSGPKTAPVDANQAYGLSENKSDPIKQFASNAHEEWRKNFDPTGTKPRIKKNSDGTEGDINVPFEKLHPDWKKENLAAGHAAHHAVKHFGNNMEKAAEHVHNEWMKRNPKADYNAAQHVPYEQLPDDEKEKDRVHVRTMMRLMGHHPKQDVTEDTMFGDDQAFIDSIIDPADKEKYLNQLKKTKDIWALSLVNKSLRTAAYSEIYKLKDLKKQLARKYNIASNVDDEEQGVAEGWKTGAAIGGTLGALAGGPIGAAIGAGAGGFIGSVHSDAKKQLDKEYALKASADSAQLKAFVEDWVLYLEEVLGDVYSESGGTLTRDDFGNYQKNNHRLWSKLIAIHTHYAAEIYSVANKKGSIKEKFYDIQQYGESAERELRKLHILSSEESAQQGVAGDLTEMDKSEPSAGRDTGPRPGPEKIAKPITKEKMVNHALDTLSKSMAKKDDKKKDVKESDTLMIKLKKALIKEGRVKELADDLKTMSDADFMKKYGKAKAAIRKDMTRVDEARTDYTPEEMADMLSGKRSQKQIDADAERTRGPNKAPPTKESTQSRAKRLNEKMSTGDTLAAGTGISRLGKKDMEPEIDFRKGLVGDDSEFFEPDVRIGKPVEPDKADTDAFMSAVDSYGEQNPYMQSWGGKYADQDTRVAPLMPGEFNVGGTTWRRVEDPAAVPAKKEVQWIPSSEADSIASWKANNPGKLAADWGSIPAASKSSAVGGSPNMRWNSQTRAQEKLDPRTGTWVPVPADASGANPNIDAATRDRARAWAAQQNAPGAALAGAMRSSGTPVDTVKKKTDWKTIYNLNKSIIGDNPNSIKPGMKLKMPDGSTYRVQPGDNLSKIAGNQINEQSALPPDQAARLAPYLQKGADGSQYYNLPTTNPGETGATMGQTNISPAALAQIKSPQGQQGIIKQLLAMTEPKNAVPQATTTATDVSGQYSGGLEELSTNQLSRYKTAAAADAKAADQAGDFKRGDKRFHGIVQATKKQFDNDAKKVDESRAARRALMARIANSR